MSEVFSQPYQLKTCACDHNGQWKPGDIMVQLQDIAGAQCTSLGFGRKAIYAKYGVVWVVTRMQINMRRYPSFGDTVTLTTYAGKTRRFFYPRSTLIKDARGEQIGECMSQWVLCDVKDRKMQNVPEIAETFPVSDLAPAIPTFMSPADIKEGLREEIREPVYTDLDANGHVNNTRYVDWLCDTLGIPLMTEKQIASLLIDYRHELRPGQAVNLRLGHTDTEYAMSGYVDGTLCFDISGQLAGREKNA